MNLEGYIRDEPRSGGGKGRSDLTLLLGDAGAFRELVESWAGRDEVRLELTGPWVPYSFVRWGESA